jgi:hypothetical protein
MQRDSLEAEPPELKKDKKNKNTTPYGMVDKLTSGTYDVSSGAEIINS